MQRPDLTTLACVNAECQYFGRPHQVLMALTVVDYQVKSINTDP